MHTTRKVCIAAAAVTGLFAGPAAAQSVEWKDDGTVLLHLGEAYNDAVIQTTREELGSEFGPDKKPFEGVTITVTVNGAGPKGGISGPLHQFRPIWEELSGGKVNIVELPFAEHYTKMMLDLQERHRPVRRLHGRRVLVRRHRACRLRFSDRRADGLGHVSQVDL